jgi:LmbE family N-acetylglucosaminyl deacetylase
MRKALIVAAHPDDEVLGAGGAIARLAAEGVAVHVLILGEGATSRGKARRKSKNKPAAVRSLERAARKAAKILGAASVSFGSLPDNRFDSVDLLEIVKLVEKHVARVRPEAVFTHFSGDLNVDHRLSFEATMAACRPLPGAPVREVYSFEVPSSTGWAGPEPERAFVPTVYVDISAQLHLKQAALTAYAGEVRPSPHPRSAEAVEALARWRGAEAGLAAAEAYVLVREVK